MDMMHEANAHFPSHFEYFAALNHPDRLERVRYQALTAMTTLEGWCSQYKAALLIDLVLMTAPEVIVEIGVWGGKSLIPMAYALRENGKGKIYGIDPWSSNESIKGMDGVNKDWWGSVNHQKILDGLIQKVNQYGLQDQVQLIRSTSLDAAPIEQIGILHIDGNHSEDCSYLDVIKWVPYVKRGGLILFDDVYWGTTTKAVEWLDANCIRFAEIGSDNIWGIWIKN